MPPKSKKLISLILCFLLIFQQTGFAQTVTLNLSNYLSQSSQPVVSDKFRPVHLRYLSYDSLNNSFKLLLDQGSLKQEKTALSPLSNQPANQPTNQLNSITQELLKYFFIGLTLPNSSFWVNLRPDAPDNIIDEDLAKTDIGKILLEADLNLKKDTSNWTSPQTPEGKAYWDKLYQKAEELYGTSQITIPTLTRPWIVPDEIILRESPDASAYIYKATLKVMLEEDYLSRVAGSRNLLDTLAGKNSNNSISSSNSINYSFNDPRLKELNQYSTQLIKELIIPKLTQEINSSKRYAPLRQVYYSLILAQHFKNKLTNKSGPYSSLIDSKDLTNLTSSEPWDKFTYFKEYQKSFQEGEYNLKANQSTTYGQVIRRYMSGGVELGNSGSSALIIPTKDNRIIDHPEILKVSSAILLGDLKAFGRPTEAIKSSSPLGNNREKAEEYTIKFLKEFGYPGDLFGGIKKLDNPNAAADVVYGATVAESRIYFNEDWIGALTIDLIERIAAHEAQHIKTFELSERGLKLERLNEIEEFKALQLRVGDYYDKISKTEKALPHTKEEYQSPAELLSRLRGYWAYLMQIEKEDKITIRPREFVGVFKEEDLKFLNEEYLFFITFSDNFVAQGIVEHNMYVKNKSEAGNQKLEVSSAVKAGEDLYNDAQAVLYVSKPEDLQISDNPKIKRIWGEMVEENLKLYKFAQGLTRLSRKYGVIKEFPEDELNNLCKFYNNLNQKDPAYNLGFITFNSGIKTEDDSLLSAQFKFNLLFLVSMVYAKIKPAELFNEERSNARLISKDDLDKIATGGKLKEGNNFYEYIWKPFKEIKSFIWKEIGEKKVNGFFEKFESLLKIFQQERESYHEIARVRYAGKKPHMIILEQYRDQLRALINSPREYIEQQEPIAKYAPEGGKIGDVVKNPGGLLLPGESVGKVRKFTLNGLEFYAKRVNPLWTRYPEEEIMISLEVDKSLKKISPYFGVQEFIGIIYDQGAFYLLSRAIVNEQPRPEATKDQNYFKQFESAVVEILVNFGVPKAEIQNLVVNKIGKDYCVFLDFETHPNNPVKNANKAPEALKSSSAITPVQMRKWIEEILKANKTPREIFSLLSEEEKKDLINEFDKRMGYKFDPDSPGFLRGHVLADDGNMKKLLTITRELKEDFDKEDYAHIYYLGRSSRWFIRMLEFLSTPVDKKVYAQIPFSGGWYEDKAGSDELVETKDKPEAVQVAVYGENLSRIGFNPQDIIKRPGKTVIMEYVDKGGGLKSFLLTLLELAKLRGVDGTGLEKLKSKIVVYALRKKNKPEMDLSREQFFNFEIVPFRIDDELLAGLANTDEFEDGIGASYPMDEWHNPPQYEMTENAFLILMRIARYIENASAPIASIEKKGGIDLTALATADKSSLNHPLTANMLIAGSAVSLDINLDNELRQIQDMLNAGIMPSSERIREYALASSSLKPEDYNREIDKILGCIADIFRLEEEKAKPTPQALKDALILLESDRPAPLQIL